MRGFCLVFPIHDAVRRELSWTHYRTLLWVDSEAERANSCAIRSCWSFSGYPQAQSCWRGPPRSCMFGPHRPP
ncbi:DUF1016 domain-containing protein [Massilia rubra]|uniref:DUF1016 domain-containing protein n=1 Tax=Massilia rubra TaxID=2607910 RepID=A0ABX0LP97_9BURK|nr:DUF1016 domain-containing protein [Massilia rubra]NHZ34215.1 DUF1016 domain-containing protein [Massilia rubra]